MHRRWLASFCTLLLLWAVMGEINHHLAVWQLHLFVGALYVTFNALRLPARPGFIATVLGGLLCDAGVPGPFGAHLVLFVAAHSLVFNLRHRIPAGETASRVIMAVLINFGLFLAFAILWSVRLPAPGAMWPRQLLELLLSQAFLVLIAPWFFALQERALVLARCEDRTRF